MDKPLVQRILELEEKVKELEIEMRGPEGLQRHIGKIRDVVGMNNPIKEKKKHGNSKTKRRD